MKTNEEKTPLNGSELKKVNGGGEAPACIGQPAAAAFPGEKLQLYGMPEKRRDEEYVMVVMREQDREKKA